MEPKRLIDLDGVVRRKKEIAKTSIYLAWNKFRLAYRWIW